MSDCVPNNRHLREVFIFFFYSKKTATEAHRELHKFYEDAALSETTCRDWFRRSKEGDFDAVDRPREGRPKTFEDAGVIYYELLKPNETITGERYRTQLMLGLTLPNPLKPTWKRLNGKSYPIRRIPQILRRLIITCSSRWHMFWLISSCAHMKTSKNGLIRG